jgi:hypothetical protein
MPTPRKYPTAAARQAAYRLRGREQAQAPGRVRAWPARLGPRRWEAMCSQAREVIEQLRQELEAYADARAEAWQESERGEAFAETLEAVQQIAEALGEISFA